MNNQIKETISYLKEEGWSLKNDYNIITEDINHLVEAYINTDDWVITLNIKKNLNEEVKNIIKNNGLEKLFNYRTMPNNLIKTVAGHEIGHYKYCPRSIDNFVEILEGVSVAINKESSIVKKSLEKNKFNIANMFTDIVTNGCIGLDNIIYNKNNGFNDGQTFFYLSEGFLAEQMNPAYSVFSGINLNIFQPDKAKRKCVEKYFPPILDNNIIRKGVEIFTGSVKNDYIHALINLLNENEFRKKAYEFTNLIKNYMPPDKEELENIISDNFMTAKFKEDAEFQKRVKKKLVSGNKSGNNSFVPSDEFNDLYYQNEAEKYLVSFNPDFVAEKFEFLDVGSKEWEGDFDRINPLNIVPDRNGKLVFSQSAYRESLSIKHAGTNIDFPDILFLFDTSGSMMGEPYDLLLRAIYASLHYLEETEKGFDLNYNFTAFSNNTVSSGWVKHYELEEARRKYLLHPESGGTSIDINVLSGIIDNRRNFFHTILVTDGEINNEKSVAGLFEGEVLSKGSTLDYISIGRAGTHLKTLAKNNENARCSEIYDEKDLIGLILGITKKVYG